MERVVTVKPTAVGIHPADNFAVVKYGFPIGHGADGSRRIRSPAFIH